MQAKWHRNNTWMVRQVQIRLQWACGRRCHGLAGQMSLSGTEKESRSPLNGQLHGWMSPGERRVSVEKDERGKEERIGGTRCRATSKEREKGMEGDRDGKERYRRLGGYGMGQERVTNDDG